MIITRIQLVATYTCVNSRRLCSSRFSAISSSLVERRSIPSASHPIPCITMMQSKLSSSSSSSFSPALSTTDLSESKFHYVADEFLERLLESLTPIEDLDILEDIKFSQGVLSINLGCKGCWVINKQTPNRQLWWSSPQSGPRRYEYLLKNGVGCWVYTRDGSELLPTLAAELFKATGRTII